MDKMKMESVDMTAQNIDKIAALFPNCITETVDENGKPKKVINFELLHQMLSEDVLEGDEAYEFTWVGKKAAIVEANKPIRKTLRPCPKESKDWDTTENLYIEGDNLEVLKLLQESYLGKVKMIYIDPPYNTGNDFVYRDSFKRTQGEENKQMGMYDEDENRLFRNTDSNGRFHSDWCSMIYPRLMLARNLLSDDDGVIFISIDDNEVDNLKKICDEVFVEENFINNFLYLHGKGKKDRWSRTTEQYILAYAKDKSKLLPWLDTQLVKGKFSNPDNDPRGEWFSGSISFSEERSNKQHKNYFTIVSPSGIKWTRQWQCTKQEMDEHIKNNKIYFGLSPEYSNTPRIKKFPKDTIEIIPSNLLSGFDSTRAAQQYTDELLGVNNIFDNPKPVNLIKHLIEISSNSNDIILDFFSGSATTAHAVMQLNAEDGGHRKFIMVQLSEPCEEKSEAYKAGYKNICEIGKERIRRAAKKIHEDYPKVEFDDGFRVFKLDDTNMKDVYYSAGEYTQTMLSELESNIKEDRTDLDLLFGCLLEWGLPLSMPYTSEQIEGCTVHTYNGGDLIACFDENIPDEVIKTIAGRKPRRAVFRDSSFDSSPAKINVGEIFKMLAPKTSVKVI